MKKFLLKYKAFIGLGFSIIFLFLSLRKIEFNEIMEVFRRSDTSTVVIIILLAFAVRIILTFRWYLLLHFTPKRKLNDVFNFLNIGYFLNDILPGRIGDFVKSFFWAKKVKVSKTDALTSVIVERLFDLSGMGLIFLLALMILDLPSYALNGGIILIIICIAGFLGLLVLAINNSILSRLNEKYKDKKLPAWILSKISKLSLYSTFLVNFRLTLTLAVLTIFVWFIYLLSGYVIIENLHPGQYSWSTSVISLLFISVAFIIPSTPGNIGVYQYACILAFEVTGAGYVKEEALVFSLISQVPVYFLTLILGLYSSYSEGFKITRLKKYTDNLETVEI